MIMIMRSLWSKKGIPYEQNTFLRPYVFSLWPAINE